MNTTMLKEVDAATVREWIEKGEAMLIDVREPDEHAQERIVGARLVPLSRFSPADVPATDGRKIVLHCRSGKRSQEAGARLVQASACEAFSLKGGLEAWKAAGLPIHAAGARLPIGIMRQTQIAIGSGVALGVALSLISPWFLVIPAFFGCGMVFAGVTGTCGMASMIARMPWNKGLRCVACTA